MKKYFIVALLLSLTCGVCHAQRQNSGVKEFEAECLGVEGDGSQTIRAYGFGKDKDDAVEQAQKNAVYAVIFKGITKGSGCNMKPLLTEVNAREKYEDYFDNFFKDDGPFEDFVSMEWTSRYSLGKSIVSRWYIWIMRLPHKNRSAC